MAATKHHELATIVDPSQIEPLVSAAEVAPLLGCSRSMVYGLHRTQGLPGTRVGSRIKFLVSKVIAWRESRELVVTVRREDVVQGTIPPPSPLRRGRMTKVERQRDAEEFPE